jgi:DNA-binding transcriptional ArsR family regulator
LFDGLRTITASTVSLHHPPTDELELTAVLHALSDPQRLRIVQLLAEQDMPVPCGSLPLGISKSTATHHFRVLREAGLIEQSPTGTTKLTALRRADLDARFPGLLEIVLASPRALAASGSGN